MPLFNSLRLYLYHRKIKQLPQTNLEQLKSDHFNRIKSVGILFDGTNPAHHIPVRKFADELIQKGKDVRTLAFLDIKKIPDTPDFPFFSQEDLTFAFIPNDLTSKEFTQQRFDVLINLDPFAKLPLTYLSAASLALFKIGPVREDTRFFDLMIELNDAFELPKFIIELRKTFNKIA